MIILVYLTFVFIIYYFSYLWNTYNYWRRKGIVGPTPLPWFGNYASVIFRYTSEGDYIRNVYEKYPNEKFIGIYKGVIPTLLVKDSKTMKQVLIKDFYAFNSRCVEEPAMVFDKSLFVMDGNKEWRDMRQINSPVFTKSKLTKITPLIYYTVENLIRDINLKLTEHREIEMRALFSTYSYEVMINTIFGVELESQNLRHTMDQILLSQLKPSLGHTLLITFPQVTSILAPLVRQWYMKFVNNFNKFTLSCLYAGKSKDNTVLEFMRELKHKSMNGSGMKIKVDDNTICQQLMTYTLAGYEVIAYDTCLVMYKLAMHEEIQKKCYEEVINIDKKYNGKITWNAVSEAKYLELILNEVLRMYPGNNVIDRKCTVQKYKFPGTDLVIDKDVFVFLSTHGINYDDEYFSDPEVFNPDRFSSENNSKFTPNVFLPFGDGPRHCIGKRFALYVIMFTIFCLIRKYKILRCTKTQETLQIDPNKLMISRAIGSIWAAFEPRNVDV